MKLHCPKAGRFRHVLQAPGHPTSDNHVASASYKLIAGNRSDILKVAPKSLEL